jgi:hypothetical protein
MSAFSSSNYVTPPVAVYLCACFAKTSVVWIPMLYISTSTQFRFSLVDKHVSDKLAGNSTVGEVANAPGIVRKIEKNSNTAQ